MVGLLDDGDALDVDFRRTHQIFVDFALDFDPGVRVDALAGEVFVVNFGRDRAGAVTELVFVAGYAGNDLAAQGNIGIIDRIFQDVGDVVVRCGLVGADILRIGCTGGTHDT